MFLFIDTETTGLPQDHQAPITDLGNWPRLVQLAWRIESPDRKILAEETHIIKPQGFRIPKASTLIHGIFTEQALAEGQALEKVLSLFSQAAQQSKYVIAHHVQVDLNVLSAEYIRIDQPIPLDHLIPVCTMLTTRSFVGIPTKDKKGFRNPSLTALHQKLFHEPFEGAHTALGDVRATADCFFALAGYGMLAIPEIPARF